MMEAKINIKFLEVSGKQVSEKVSKDKQFRKSTEKTISELCKQIKKYFGDFNINVETDFTIG